MEKRLAGHSNVVQSHGRSRRDTVCITVLTLTTGFTMAWCLVLTQKVSQLEITIDDLQSQVKKFTKVAPFIPQDVSFTESNPQEVAVKQNIGQTQENKLVIKRSPSGDRRRKQCRRRCSGTCNLKGICKKPFFKHLSAHLVPPEELKHKTDEVTKGKVFSWSMLPKRAHLRLGLDSRGQAITIKTTGFYYIYVQIAYRNHKNIRISSQACGHLLYKSNPEHMGRGNATSLAYSITTQNFRYGGDQVVLGQDIDMRAFDTSYTGGVYFLQREEQVYVKFDVHSDYYLCNVVYDADKTFFGGFLIDKWKP